ncbi:MAG: VWA domain-containing protein [Oscillospiraceae bacterium]|nr:VWA domain-containing protein [Oscillospiraceae bacterium]
MFAGRKAGGALTALLLAAALLLSPLSGALAVELTLAQTDGRELSLMLEDPEGLLFDLGAEAITLEADGQGCEVTALQVVGEPGLPLVMLDLSDSLSKEDFADLQEALCRQAEEGGLLLYTFGERVEQLLDGSATPEAAQTAIRSLKRDAQATDFYDAAVTLAQTAKAMGEEGKIVRPLLISDGVNNAGSADREAALAALKECPVAVTMLCSNAVGEADRSAYEAFCQEAGGRWESLPSGQAGEALLACCQTSGLLELQALLPEGMAFEKETALELDLGGRQQLTFGLDTSSLAENETTETSPEETHGEPDKLPAEEEAPDKGEEPTRETAPKEGRSRLILAGGGVVLLLVLLAVLRLRRKAPKADKSAKAKKEPKEKKVKERKKDQPQVQFFFEDK